LKLNSELLEGDGRVDGGGVSELPSSAPSPLFKVAGRKGSMAILARLQERQFRMGRSPPRKGWRS